MNIIQPKPSLTFFDFVTNSKYQLFNASITVKEFYNKFNEYKIWIEKQKPLSQRSLLKKELVNFENALNYANEQLKAKQHPYFTYFANDIQMILKYKEEIENLIITFDSIKQLENDSKTVRNKKGNIFQIEVKSKKLYIDTGKISLSWNSYLQLLVFLFFNQKLTEKEDHFIIKTILESTLINKKFITDSNKSNLVKGSENYMQKNKLFDKIKPSGFIENNLLPSTKKILENQDFMLKLEENCNELIRKINS